MLLLQEFQSLRIERQTNVQPASPLEAGLMFAALHRALGNTFCAHVSHVLPSKYLAARAGSKTQKTHTASQRSEVMILSKCQLAFARATGTWHFCFTSMSILCPNHLGTWDVEFTRFQRLERELGTTVYHLRILLI